MTTQDYLRQAYRLDQQINSDLEELASLRSMATSISSPALTERVQTSNLGDASFIQCLEKLIELEEKINREVEVLVRLKEEIRAVITTVEDTDERMVLKYRYVHNYTWERIGKEMHVDSRTVRRWHENALEHVLLPANPIGVNEKGGRPINEESPCRDYSASPSAHSATSERVS